MSINLQKGQKIELTKGNASLSRVMVGLGWDEAVPAANRQNQEIDCDAIAFLLDSNEKIAAKSDVVFFNNLEHTSGCVVHQGDNLTGAGDSDDEQILVDLAGLPAQYERVVILVSIYKASEKGQHFGMIENAFIRLVDTANGRELCKYNLSENYSGMTSMIFGEIYRHNGEWKFNAIGQPLQIWGVAQLAERYGLPLSNWR